jgi:hypothetical protein
MVFEALKNGRVLVGENIDLVRAVPEGEEAARLAIVADAETTLIAAVFGQSFPDREEDTVRLAAPDAALVLFTVAAHCQAEQLLGG